MTVTIKSDKVIKAYTLYTYTQQLCIMCTENQENRVKFVFKDFVEVFLNLPKLLNIL